MNFRLVTRPVFWMIPESTSSKLLSFLPVVSNVSKLNTVPENKLKNYTLGEQAAFSAG